MPKTRIHDEITDLGLGTQYGECFHQSLRATEWCTDTVKISADGVVNRFNLVSNSIGMGGHYLLKKNGNLIWEGDWRAMTCGPVLSAKRIGDGIAFDYIDAIPERFMDSILFVSDDRVTDVVATMDYDAAYAPCEVQGKLAYFAKIYSPEAKTFLIIDGREVGKRYDSVFNQCCCWDGPPIRVACNGQIVDFFAVKEGEWYHVQAGDLDSLK